MLHSEVKAFTRKVLKHLKHYVIESEDKTSRVVLIWNKKTILKIGFKKIGK